MEINLDKSDFEYLYPFYLAIDANGKLVSSGRSAAKCFLNLRQGLPAEEIFKITTPKTISPEVNFRKLVRKVVTLESLSTHIGLRGEVLWIEKNQLYLFAITPLIQNIETLTDKNLTYNDFPAYSPIFDFFILLQAERFARKEQMLAYDRLEEQNTYAKLNLEIANFCSSCFDIQEAFTFLNSQLETKTGWSFSLEESLSHPTSTQFAPRKVILPITKDGELRYVIHFSSKVDFVISEGLKFFFTSLRYTIENVVARMDKYSADEEIKAIKVTSAKMYTLGEMSASIAHELNNPLTIIQGLAWVTLKSVEENQWEKDKVQESMHKIIKMTERSGKIIKGLRVFARDATDDPMEPMELNSVIEETLDLCKERIKSRGIAIHWDAGRESYSTGKPVQISQVLLNLLNNSADAIETSRDPWIRISLERQNDFWIISVMDSGQGIPASIVAKMMTPFFTTKAVGKGTGLGLSIANNILKIHGGRFWYDENSNNTTFSFALPVSN